MDRLARLKLGLRYAGAALLSLIAGILVFSTKIVPNSCEYHEPINREPGRIFAFFFPQGPMGHPEPGWLYIVLWIGVGAGLCHLILKRKRRDS